MNTKQKVNQHTKKSANMGALSKVLAVMLALNMAFMLALPIGIFADDIIINGGEIEADYGDPGGQATAPEPGGTEPNQPAQDPAGGGVINVGAPDSPTADPSASSGEGVGFTPLAINPGTGVWEVSNWQDLRQAITDVNDGKATKILLMSDVARDTNGATNGTAVANDLPVITRSVEIDGGGHTLTAQAPGITTAINRNLFAYRGAGPGTITLKNIKVNRPNATTTVMIAYSNTGTPAVTGTLRTSVMANSRNWTINLENFESSGNQPAGLVNNCDGTVSFSGTIVWNQTSSSGADEYNCINARILNVNGGSNTINATSRVYRSMPTANNVNNGTTVTIQDGAKVNWKTNRTGEIQVVEINDGGWTTATSCPANFIVKGADTKVEIEGNGNAIGTVGATVSMSGGSGGFQVIEGGYLHVYSSAGNLASTSENNGGQPAIIQEVLGGTFKIGKDSTMSAESNGNSHVYGATVRLRDVGNQTWDIDGGKFEVIKNRGQASAVRLGAGGNNTFRVRNGGQVSIYNKGSGVAVNELNCGIQFYSPDWTFDLQGDLSTVQIVADYGPALSTTYNNGTIAMGQGTVFVAKGRTAGAANGAFRATGTGFKFNANNPYFYDFANTRPGGGRVFEVGSTSATATESYFESLNSDISFWRSGTGANSDIWDGDPAPGLRYTRINLKAVRANLGTWTVQPTGIPAGGFTPYTRIAGNNAPPQVKESLLLTNADKHVRFIGIVPEGTLSLPRPVQTGEVFGRFQLTHNGVVSEVPFESLLNRNPIVDEYYEQEKVSSPRDGLLRYSTPGGSFLIPGDVWEVKSAWRGPSDTPGGANNHNAVPGVDITVPPQTVIDVLPTDPVTITSHTGSFWMDERVISGTYPDMSAVAHNNDQVTAVYASIDGTSYPATLGANRSWTVTLPAGLTLSSDQKIYIIAVDGNNNHNPLEETKVHDAVVLPAPYLTVKEFPVKLLFTETTIGLKDARAIQGATNEYSALKDAINAKAEVKQGMPNPYSLEVAVTGDGGFSLEDFNYPAFGEQIKPYDIPFSLVDYPAYSTNGKINVFPREIIEGGIGANDFSISQNNADVMMAKPAEQRNAELKARAQAIATEHYNYELGAGYGPLSPDFAEFDSVVLPTPAVPGGDYSVTFRMKNATDIKVTVKITVIAGNLPTLVATTPINIWAGNPANQPAKTILPSEYSDMMGVSAHDHAGNGAADITSSVIVTKAADLNIINKPQTVTYSVTNSDNNTVNASRTVLVFNKGIPEDGYYLIANSFVATSTEVTNNPSPALNGFVVTRSYAEAWFLEDESGVAIPTTAVVREFNGMSPTANEYNVVLGVTQVGNHPSANVLLPVTGKVVAKDVLDQGIAAYDTKYAVVANNISRTVPAASGHDGLSDTAKQWLISQFAAAAYALPLAPPAAIDSHTVDVKSNGLPAIPVTDGVYEVEFIPTGIGDYASGYPIVCKVTITVSGTAPVITFDPDSQPGKNDGGFPLVVAQTPNASHFMTANEVKAKMQVVDPVEPNLLAITEFSVNNGPWTNGISTIDTQNVGVYSVKYRVTDTDGLSDEKTRAIVVTDGRYVIDKTDSVIIGAKNFVKLKSGVIGTQVEVRDSSGATAYTIEGVALASSQLVISNWASAGYGPGANEGTYNFDWKVTGYPTAVKQIKGYVVDGHEIFPGGVNDQYAIVASNFNKTISEAEAMLVGDKATNEITAAKAQYFKLVDAAPDARLYVVSDDGFPGNPTTIRAYPITFGIQKQTGASTWEVVVTSPQSRVVINGTVGKGIPPVLSVTAPIQINVGGTFNRNVGVALSDAEDDLLPGGPLTAADASLNDLGKPVNVDVAGLYPMVYSYTDTDGNPTSPEAGQRVLVVNDGHYVVSDDTSPHDGRIIYAQSFVIRASEVAVAAQKDNQLKTKSGLKLFNGKTAAELSTSLANIGANTYAPTPGDYPISFTVADVPSGTLTKNITAAVVDADIIWPEEPNAHGDTTHIYGTNRVMTVSEAEAVAAAGLLNTGGVKDALGAGAIKNAAGGAITHPVVGITDTDSFISRLTGSNASQKSGVFRFTVTDTPDNAESYVFTITVGTGKMPLLTVAPKPLNIQMPVSAGDKSGNNISNAKIMDGVLATDEEAITAQNPTGNITSEVTYTIENAQGNVISNIPADVAAFYKVTYRIEDSDHNVVVNSRAILVNDGRFEYNSEYVLEARSFIINKSQVSAAGATEQLKQMTEAKAWRSDGTAATVSIGSNTYTNVVNLVGYQIPVNGGNIEKIVYARVIEDTTPPALPGASIGDGNSDNGDRYAIYAANFRINTVDANALVAKNGTPAYGAEFLQRAGVVGYDRTHNSFGTGGSPAFVNASNFASSGTLVEGNRFDITFKIAEDDAATVTIKAFVSNAESPVIHLPQTRVIWTGSPTDPNRPAGSLTVGEFNYITSGQPQGVYATDDIDSPAAINAALKYGKLVSGSFVQDAAPINFGNVPPGIYPVAYSVTDSDHNTTGAMDQIVVDLGVPDGDYLTKGYDFFTTVHEMNGSSASIDDQIRAYSFAEAWLIDKTDPMNVVVSNVQPVIKANGGLTAAVNTYPGIRIGVNPVPPFVGNPITEVTGKVLDKDFIARGPSTNSTYKYTVAGNSIQLMPNEAMSYRGTGDTAKANIITATAAEGYTIPALGGATGGLGTSYVEVLSNELTATTTPVPNTGYKVVVYPRGVPGAPDNPAVRLELTIHIVHDPPPTIEFTRIPLVVPQAATSQTMTEAELKQYVVVTDAEDIAAGYPTQLEVTPLDGNGQPLQGGIDKSQIGVYRVRYVATDQANHSATAYRAVVVTDGRYVITDADGDNKLDSGHVIIGARNFVQKAELADSNIGVLKGLSYAEAFDATGIELSSQLELASAVLPGYIAKTEGEYPFTWRVPSYQTNKAVKGTLVKADYIDQGGKNSQYAIVASNFEVNTTDAQAIINGGEPAFVTAGNVRVYKLVDGVADKAPRLDTQGGFAAAPSTPDYTITYRIDGIPVTTQRAISKAKVSDGTLPDLKAQAPLYVWVGDPASSKRTAGSILPAQYNDKYGVTVTDIEDAAKGQDLTLADVIVSYPNTPVPAVLDSLAVGNYEVHFEVTDSDHNTSVADRVVIVNDGTVIPGVLRSLRARPFVIKSSDVTTNSTLIDSQLLLQTKARLFDNKTNADYTTDLFIPANGRDGYSPTPKVYNVVVGGHDGPRPIPPGGNYPDILAPVQAEVVNADVLAVSPDSPTLPNYYIFGNNIQLTPVEAQAVVDAANKNSALVAALGAGARKTVAENGSLSNLGVVIDGHSNFLDRSFYSGGQPVSGSMGVYNITVKDAENKVSATLTVQVGTGRLPWIEFSPDPLVLDISSTAGNLTTTQLMQGVTGRDLDDEDAGIPVNAVIVGSPAIPGDVAGVTQVNYSVTDAAGNTTPAVRAVVVNDGSIYVGTQYIIKAHSFMINKDDVDLVNREAQIKTLSQARGWTKKGEDVQIARVAIDPSHGYTNSVGDWPVTIFMQDEPSAKRGITAKVVNDPIIDNGDRYSISGNPFRLNYQDANSAKAMNSTQLAELFITKAAVKSYLRAGNMSNQSGTKVMISDGGFAAHAPFVDADEGLQFDVKFQVAEDPTAEITVRLTISRGTPPVLTVDPVVVSSPLNVALTDSFLRNGVTANDNEDANITNKVIYDASAVDITKKGFYTVGYSVTDSDYNTVTAQRLVAVGIPASGDYLVDAYDFVVTKKEATDAGGNTDALIKAASFAQAWFIDKSNPNNIVITEMPSVLAVKSNAGFSANAASYPVTYQPIVIGVNPVPPFIGDPLKNIVGKVVDKEIIDRGPDDGSSNDIYTVAANPITLFPAEAEAYRGTSDSAKGNIIQAMAAEGYKASSDTAGTTTVGGLGINYVDVLSNELAAGATPEPGRTYKVVLYPKGVPGAPNNPAVKIEVNMVITKGHSPVIEFTRIPLVVTQTAASQIMSDADLKEYVDLSDVEDRASGYSTRLDVQVLGENGQPLPGGIDRSKIGVYKVRYTATDQHDNQTVAYRAVVVNDGRYVITDANNDNKIDANHVILGARNFVVKQEDVDPTADTIRSLSYAEAYDKEGNSLNSSLALPNIPAGYNTSAAEGNYNFTWQVTGYLTTKPIIGSVVVATIVDSGGKDSQYSIAASDFKVNRVDALAIVTAGESAFITAANVRVFKLVPGVPDKLPKLNNTGGFTNVAVPPGYNITYNIDGIPITSQKAIINGRVSDGEEPDLQVPTPLVVWVGDPGASDRTAGSILPAAYEAKYGVTVSDVEDTAKGQPLTLNDVVVSYPDTPVPTVLDANAVGNYSVHFEVTDSDHNMVPKDRVVIVNDGRIKVDTERSLRANGFVIKSEDVTTTPSLIDTQLLNQTDALLFDNITNVSYSNDRFIQNRDGYSPTPKVYNIAVGGRGGIGRPDIVKTVQAEVVDADVIESGPDDPNKTKYHIYGNNIQLSPVEAQAVVDAADKNAALITALSSYARVSQPNGTLAPVGVVIDNHSNFLNRTFYTGGAAVPGSMGEYNVTVKDSGSHISAVLKVAVGVGSLPRINFNPDPLELNIASTPGNLSTAQLMQGVTATDQEDNAAGLTLTPTVVGSPAIPGDVAGVTTVTYTVADSAGNVVTAERAVVINDGSIIIGTNYILRAHSFIIHVNNVDVANRESQIKAMSHARGWTKKGAEIAQARVSVNSHGGYTATVNDYNVTIGMLDEPSLTRSINAKVVGDDIVVNGDRYSITGNHFRLNYQDANAAKAMSYNDRTALFTSRAGVKSYLRAGMMGTQSGTVVMTSDGGFATSANFTDADEGKVFQVTFWVDEDHTATETVNCTISRGTRPVLTVPHMKVSPVNTPITEAFYRDGVVAYDAEDTSLTAASVIFDASAVNIYVVGNYKVVYSVTDSDHNTVTAIGGIYVGDGDIDKDYMTAGSSFVTTVDAITEAADKNQLILDLSHAKAWRITPANPTEDVPVPVQPVIKVNGNLAAVAGVYPGIQIGVNPEAPYEGNPRTTITATVLDKEIISNKPDVDDGTQIAPPDGNDKNIDNPSDQNRYVVAADYGTIRLSEVNDFVGMGALAKSRLISRAGAESYRIVPTSSSAAPEPWGVDILNNPIPANAAAGSSYWVTFVAQGVPSVWVKAKFTVSLGNDPVINIDGPLVKTATEAPTPLYRNDLMQGVTASDVEDGPLTSAVEVLEPGTDHMPNIDLSKPGIYPVTYTVADKDGNTTTAGRSVIVNDGRYDLIDEDGDKKIDIIIGAKNFALRQADAFGTLVEAKNLSYVEAYDTRGQDLSGIVMLGHALPSGYAAKNVGVYDFNWQLQGHSNLVSKAVKGEILSNDYIVDPGDKSSSYALAAKNFSVNTTVAATITSEPAYVSAASARVIKLVNSAPNKNPVLFSNGGFQAVQGSYNVIFGAVGISQGKLALTVAGTVTDGQPPVLSCDTPIYFPIAAPGAPAIGVDAIKTIGHVTAYDPEDLDLTAYVQITDTRTNAAPSFQADAKGVHQVRLKVTDSDHNTVEKVVAVSVGVLVVGDFLIDANDFNVDLRDVTASRTIQQILELSGARAWNLEGTPVQVSVSTTGGYRDAAGTYHPVVAVYDSVGGVTSGASIELPITATVVDTFTRYRVTFDGNGGTLIGPRSILVVEPATSLPYMPASPIRDSYNFRYWATSPSGGAQFTADTTLTSDITVYAQWAFIPPPEVPVQQPPTIIVNPPAAGSSTTYVTVPPDNVEVNVPPSPTPTTPAPEPTKVEPAPVPTTNASEPSWSLFNLLATIVALLLLVAFFIKFFFDRPRDEEYEEEPIDAQLWAAMTPDQRIQYQARRELDYQTWLNDQQRRNGMRKAMYVNAPVLLIVGAALVEALIVLGMTQDFGATMKPVDDLSVIFAAVVFVQLLTPMVAAVIHNNRRIAQQPSRPAQLPLSPSTAQPVSINRDVTL